MIAHYVLVQKSLPNENVYQKIFFFAYPKSYLCFKSMTSYPILSCLISFYSLPYPIPLKKNIENFQTDQKTIEIDQRKIAARKYKTKAL